jgi:hypothetical protein
MATLQVGSVFDCSDALRLACGECFTSVFCDGEADEGAIARVRIFTGIVWRWGLQARPGSILGAVL